MLTSTAVLDHLSDPTPAHGLIVALIPAYNEDRFIASVVLKARRYVDQVIVVMTDRRI